MEKKLSGGIIEKVAGLAMIAEMLKSPSPKVKTTTTTHSSLPLTNAQPKKRAATKRQRKARKIERINRKK